MFILINFFFSGNRATWSSWLRHYCFVLVDSITANSAASDEIKEEVNEQDEAKEEEVNVVALDVLCCILEDEVVREESSLSKTKDNSFHHWILEVFFPDVNERVKNESNHDAVQIDV